MLRPVSGEFRTASFRPGKENTDRPDKSWSFGRKRGREGYGTDPHAIQHKGGGGKPT